MQPLPKIALLKDHPPLQASKWIDQQVLLDDQEMQTLLQVLEEPLIYLSGTIWKEKAFKEHRKQFLDYYKEYIANLKTGKLPDLQKSRTLFAACLTSTLDAVYLQDVRQEQFLIRPTLPIIQLQHHTMTYSPHDIKMHSMVFGKNYFYWGIQFSYPQMYLHPVTHQVCQTRGSQGEHANASLFKTLQRWLRQYALPVTFIVDGHQIETAIRLGKNCFEWIQNHPQWGQFLVKGVF